MMESLEPRMLMAAGAIFSTNSVKRLYNEVIGAEPSGSRVIRYKNVTNKSVTIPAGGVIVSGAQANEYKIISNFTLPRGLKPGVAIKFSLVFNPPANETAGIKTGLFTVLTTRDTSKSVRLRGIATTGLGGSNEPSLQRILDLYQIPDNVGDSDPTTDALDVPPVTPNSALNIQTLQKAGAGNVTAYPIAAFVQVVNPSLDFGYYTNSNANDKTQLFTLANTDAQSVNPNATGSITFNPGATPFGLYVTYPGVPQTSYSESALNTWEPTVADRRKALFYPLKNKDGSLVPNSYVVAFEDLTASVGVDYQDGVFIIQNVKPAS